jgi:hypothetical protein
MSFRLSLLLALGAAIWAQPSPRPTPRPAFQGKVIDAETGRPIPEATVTLTRPSSRDAAPSPTRKTISDAQGRFAFSAVADGVYLITASRRGFFDIRPTPRYFSSPRGSNEPIVLKLVPQAIIRGSVVDEDGDVPLHVSVSLLRREFLNGGSHYEVARSVRVREDGTFVVGGILPGHYYLAASAGPNTTNAIESRLSKIPVETFYPDVTDKASARLIAIATGQELNGLVIRLKSEPLYSVRGHLDGIEMEQFSFFPRGGIGQNPDRLRVDSYGSFEIRLRAGDYLIAGSATQNRRRNRSFRFIRR